ncbi:zinc ribbon domain-containing protein [Siccirubricoccus deserti]
MATPASNRTLPAIQVDPTNKPYFDAAREGRLLIGLCKDTNKHFWYPRGCSPSPSRTMSSWCRPRVPAPSTPTR